MEIEVGRVTHFYNHLCVAVLSLKIGLKIGDTIHILGHQTDFTQRVNSMEIEHHNVVLVKPGEDVAIKVIEPVRVNDIVYRVVQGTAEPIAA
ncbi:MAG: hypothetical protein M1282_10860 [Chloroflexi bacterium]|nr:hypothetical protein [Chloroflexota bacterium]